MSDQSTLSRRSFLRALGLVGLAGGAAAAGRLLPGSSPPIAHAHSSGTSPHAHGAAEGTPTPTPAPPVHNGHSGTSGNMVKGTVDPANNGFDPSEMLTSFDTGRVSTLPSGQTLREFELIAADQVIEIAPGLTFPAWSYNRRVPGPTLRCTQGDRVRVNFFNASSHPHSVHFHGIHTAAMDGVEPIAPGGSFVYEFDAEPFGLHLYHCHTVPLRRHFHKGLYGTFIIDPPQPRPAAHELVMVMNAFDTDFDGENEVYAVNTVAFHYAQHPIPIKLGELVRVYLVNATEFDPINSFHLHANFFNVFRTGTRLEPSDYTDIIALCQAERHILEFRFKFPGQYMFHAHQNEFTELGWMGIFDVTETGGSSTGTPAAMSASCHHGGSVCQP